MSKPLNIALIGFGNIGTGLVRHLQQKTDLINSRVPRPIRLTTICDVDLATPRGIPTSEYRLTGDYKTVIADPQVEVVVELVGGTRIAHTIVTEALTAGKHVVTANKALMATFGGELLRLAAQNDVHILYEASVGAGIPTIRSLQTILLPNQINAVYGILNGTCNFILTSMEDNPGETEEEALREALKRGYAEPDPTLDVEGDDTAHKIAIMASLAFGRDLRIDNVTKCGITRLGPEDAAYARKNGMSIKLLAGAQLLPDGTPDLWVWPAFVPHKHLLSGVRGVLNALWVEADPIGPTMYYGAGAGQESTSSGILSDLMLISQARDHRTLDALLPLRIAEEANRTNGRHTRHPRDYVRVRTPDPANVQATINWKVLDQGPNSIAFEAPERSEEEHQEMLGILQGLGIDGREVSEIRFAFQG